MGTLLSANDIEAVLGSKVQLGIETIECRIREMMMNEIAEGSGDLTAMFKKFDVNGDGSITRSEMLDGLISEGLNTDDFIDANEEMDKFMKKIDRGLFEHELDGKIDYQEFIKFIFSHGEFSSHDINFGIHRPTVLIADRGVKLVGLLFGQQWNPQYAKVEQKVRKFYDNLKAMGENRFEIVYVSLDQDVRRFTDYYRNMPWLAIPFAQKERRHYLAKKYFVASAPRLVLLDTHGNLISYDVKNDACDYYERPFIAFDSWMAGKVREVSHAGVAFY